MKPKHKIPRIIHYCWFGRNEKPNIVKNCISSWSKLLPNYEIKEWNEDNFDLSCIPYVEEAYKCEKYAFVSDYVRVYALFHFGGIYLDTDVEVYKTFDDLLDYDSFWGFEQENFIATSTIGASKGNLLIKEFLDSYNNKRFIRDDGSYEEITNVFLITEMLKKHGLKTNGEFQELKGMGAFFPQTYFSPYDYINFRDFSSENTYAKHHFYKSWLPPSIKIKTYLKKSIASVIGGETIFKIRKSLSSRVK